MAVLRLRRDLTVAMWSVQCVSPAHVVSARIYICSVYVHVTNFLMGTVKLISNSSHYLFTWTPTQSTGPSCSVWRCTWCPFTCSTSWLTLSCVTVAGSKPKPRESSAWATFICWPSWPEAWGAFHTGCWAGPTGALTWPSWSDAWGACPSRSLLI